MNANAFREAADAEGAAIAMAKTGGKSGDWLLIEELFERGDPAFVDALRQFDDAEVLGSFASRWFADRRPEARNLLFAYLDRPLNAFRHEALVKRLFKLAEKPPVTTAHGPVSRGLRPFDPASHGEKGPLRVARDRGRADRECPGRLLARSRV